MLRSIYRKGNGEKSDGGVGTILGGALRGDLYKGGIFEQRIGRRSWLFKDLGESTF